MSKNMVWIAAVMLVAAVVLGQAFLTGPNPASFGNANAASLAAEDSDSDPRTITVNSSFTVSAEPTKAELWLSVETVSSNAATSQQQNAALTQKVMDALKAQGLSADDIETSSYSLYEKNEWNRETQETEFKGYQTTNSLKVTVKDLSKTGKVIDAAVAAGANRVDSISFTVEDNALEQLKLQALTKAGQSAQGKATAIATGLNVQIKNVLSANESGVYYIPYQKSYNALAAEGVSAPETPISPGDIQVTANLTVTYEIQ